MTSKRKILWKGPIESLPIELVLQIAESCDSFRDLASLARTSKLFHQVLNPLLYKLDVRSGSPCSLFWACQFGNLETLKLVQKAGASLTQVWASKKALQDLPPNPYRHSPAFYKRVALRLPDPEDEEQAEETTDGWDEPPAVDDYDSDWDLMLDNNQQPEEQVEENVQGDMQSELQSEEGMWHVEENDTESEIDESPAVTYIPPYKETVGSEYDHSWLADTDEAGRPLLKTASQDSSYTWRNDFLDRLFEKPEHDPDFYGENPITLDNRRFPLYWWHPLDLAVRFGHKEIARYLVENGVSLLLNGQSRGLCRQRELSFEPPYQGCDHGASPLLQSRDGDWRYFVHHIFGLIACNGNWEMGNFLGEITISKPVERFLFSLGYGPQKIVSAKFEDPEYRQAFLRYLIQVLKFVGDNTAVGSLSEPVSVYQAILTSLATTVEAPGTLSGPWFWL